MKLNVYLTFISLSLLTTFISCDKEEDDNDNTNISGCTNSEALNCCKSSIFSPIPIKLIGIFNSLASANTIPPLAVPSSLVKIILSIPIVS